MSWMEFVLSITRSVRWPLAFLIVILVFRKEFQK